MSYNGICKAIAWPLLVQKFGLDPEERLENWWPPNGAKFRSCKSGRVFAADFSAGSCDEAAKEAVPAYVTEIVNASDDELAERYFKLDLGNPDRDPNEWLAAHSELSARGISQLDTVNRLLREKRGPAFDGL
jgi:hypothetical protein